MTEYIDKNKAKYEMWQALYALEDNQEKEHRLDVVERFNIQMGFEAGLQTIICMPTIDIVHCKDCKYFGAWSEGSEKYCGHLDGMGAWDYGFCSDGEREETELCSDRERKETE